MLGLIPPTKMTAVPCPARLPALFAFNFRGEAPQLMQALVLVPYPNELIEFRGCLFDPCAKGLVVLFPLAIFCPLLFSSRLRLRSSAFVSRAL